MCVYICIDRIHSNIYIYIYNICKYREENVVVASRNRKALLQSAEKLEILWCTHSAGDPNLLFPHAYTFPFSVQGRHVSTRKGKGKYENENGQYGEV